MSVREAKARLNEMREQLERDLEEQIFAIEPGGLRKLGPTGITLQPNTIYFMGASTSPDMIVVTKVSDDRLSFRKHPFKDDRTIDRRIGEDLIVRGTKTWLKTYGKYQKKLAKSLERMLDGKKGDTVNIKDLQPVKIFAVPSDDKEIKVDKNGDKSLSDKAWRAAEEFGSVSFNFKDGVIEILSDGGRAKEMKRDRRFKILKVNSE